MYGRFAGAKKEGVITRRYVLPLHLAQYAVKTLYPTPHACSYCCVLGTRPSRTEVSQTAILFYRTGGTYIHSRAVTSQSKEMDKVKKGYETRIQQDLLTDAILGKNRIKLYQQHFQVSIILRYCNRSTSRRPICIYINFSPCNVKQGRSQKK